MSLTPGTRLGPYEVVSAIGAGGMGEVYRARDSKLHRDVAIKVLLPALANDPDRLTRFSREAQILASLNHQNIGHIYGLEDAGSVRALVMELVEGPTLADRIAQGAIPLVEALPIAKQIAEALEAAHEQGIIHRDLKPANIKVRPDGTVKVLDFGLAKAMDPTASSSANAMNSPTLSIHATEAGVILGTAAYMSPEQARGKTVDKRTDIWAFGCVLYELLTGQRAFKAETVTDTLAAILEREPNWNALPAATPPAIHRLLRRCLEKDVKRRLRDIGEARIELDEAPTTNVSDRRHESRLTPSPEAGPAKSSRLLIAGAGSLALLVVLGSGWLRLHRGTTPATSPTEYVPVTNFADSATSPALSPDGRMLAFIRGENTFIGPGEIYVKLLPDGEPVQLTHDGSPKMGPPAFSPGGARIAYTVGQATWVVPALGGPPRRLLANASGLTWIEGGAGQSRVLFSESMGEGMHMAIVTSMESLAEARKVYVPPDVNGMAHRSYASPDHRWVLLVEMDLAGWLPCRLVPYDGSSIGKPVGPAPAQCTAAAWSPDGKWMYFSANTGSGFHIWRQRFPDGAPEQVTSGATEEQGIAFAPDGRSFVTSIGSSQSTVWVHDSRGDRQISSEGYSFLPSFSADGKKLYYLVRSGASRHFVSGALWVVDLESGQYERLLPDFYMEHYDVSPDGKRVVFLTADAAGHSPVWMTTLDGRSAPRRLTSMDAVRALIGADGDVFFVGGERGKPFLYRIKEDGTGLQKVVPNPVMFLYSVSRDGKWLATWVGNSVLVYPVDGGSPTLICSACATAGEENRGVTPPFVSWSPDQRFFYLHLAEPSRQTFAVPLQPGQILPPLPASGIRSPEDAAALRGARLIPQQRAFGGANPSIYAFPRVATQRNIYRIPVP